jgi:hypothetical protein
MVDWRALRRSKTELFDVVGRKGRGLALNGRAFLESLLSYISLRPFSFTRAITNKSHHREHMSEDAVLFNNTSAVSRGSLLNA